MLKYRRRLFSFDSAKARAAVQLPAIDHYNGELIETLDGIDIEHIIPLRLAWSIGFAQRYHSDRDILKQLQEFAHDPLNLIPVRAGSNRARGSKSLWEYAPLNLAWIPERNRRVRELCEKYQLAPTNEMQFAMQWSDQKLIKYRNGLHLGKVRRWLFSIGVSPSVMPF